MADPSLHSNDRCRQCFPEFSSASKIVVGLLAAASDSLDRDREATRRQIAYAVAILTRVGRGNQSRSTPGQSGLAPWNKHRLADYIEASLENRIAVADLSKMAGLSTSHFGRRFKCSFGMTPHAYILRRRVEQAKRLMLIDTELPLSQIALQCGFSDQPHFCRVFQRLAGMSPSIFRSQSAISIRRGPITNRLASPSSRAGLMPVESGTRTSNFPAAR